MKTLNPGNRMLDKLLASEPLELLVHNSTSQALALAQRHGLKVIDYRILDRPNAWFTYLYIKRSKRAERIVKQLEAWA